MPQNSLNKKMMNELESDLIRIKNCVIDGY